MEERRNNRSLSTALGVTGAIVVYIISGIALWLALNSYVAPASIKDPAKAASAKKDILQTVGLFMAGVAGGVGVYFTWQNLKQSQDALQHTQKSTERNLRLAWKSQITDRFTKAIDQIGDDKLEIRLGGIYALERVAQDSIEGKRNSIEGKDDEEDYHSQVMEILTAYVRARAPWPPIFLETKKGLAAYIRELISASTESTDERSHRDTSHTTQLPQLRQQLTSRQRPVHQEAFIGPPSVPDVQAALSVIGRRTRYYKNGEDERMNLSSTDLRMRDLREAHLEGVWFVDSNLEGALLQKAHLQEAILIRANLEGASLIGAHLEKTIFTNANLQQARLQGTDLRDAVGLTQEQIDQAKGDRNTRLPINSGLTSPAKWLRAP